MKGKNLLAILVLVFGSFQFSAFADDAGQTTMSQKDAKDQKNTVPGDQDADDILTNNKLRAETGSKSTWSVATGMVYNGGSLSRPFADYRPNIQNVNGQTPVADVEGNINVKYNITQRDSLLLGETVRFITPLSSTKTVPAGYKGQKIDSYNPGLTYQHIYKVAGFQSYYQVGPSVYTQTDLTAIGYVGNVGLYNVNAYDIGQTRLTVGMETGAGYNMFRTPRAYPQFGMSVDDTKAASTDIGLQAYPYLEYRINDTFNLRTVGMWFSIEHTLAHAGYSTWTKDVAEQSFGVGISVTRDIFLYPNVQFVPDEIRGKQTNVGLATDINIF